MFFYRFVKHPEFLKEGQRLVFREGRTKAVGNVTKIIPYVPATMTKDPKKAQSSNQVRAEDYLGYLTIKTISKGSWRWKEEDAGSRIIRTQGHWPATAASPGIIIVHKFLSIK